MKTTLQNLMDKQAKIREEIQAQGKGALTEAFKAFFEEHPSCQAIRWKQYTPYFNDGDPCRFQVREAYVRMEDTPEDAGDYEDGFEGYSSWLLDNGRYGDRSNKAIEALEKATSDADEIVGCDKELFQTVFGDHVQVTATREGFEVEEYSHD